MDVRQKIIQYHSLKKQYETLGKRLAELNEDIKGDLVLEIGDRSREHSVIEAGGLAAKLQVRRSKPKVDEALLEALLSKKCLLDLCLVEVIDHSIVESMYLQGRLTDDDLRSIGAEPKITLALIVEEIDDDCIKE